MARRSARAAHDFLHLAGACLRGRRACAPWPRASLCGDGGHQRLGEQALVGRLLGDARQRVHHREVGQRRVAGDALGQLERLVAGLAVGDQVLRQAGALALLGVVDAAGQHHVGHARGADQPRDAHRAAAADEDAALAFGQGVEGAARRPRGCGTALASSSPPPTTAPCSTATTGTRPNWTRSNAACHMRECMHALAGVALLQLGQVEAGAEVRRPRRRAPPRARCRAGSAKASRSCAISASLTARCAWPGGSGGLMATCAAAMFELSSVGGWVMVCVCRSQ